MNLTITQDNTRTETINSSIIDKLYEIAFAASSDPNSTVSLTGNLYSAKGYANKADWLNETFGPDLIITIASNGQYMLITDAALESVLKSSVGDGDGVFLDLLKAANPVDSVLGTNDNTDIVDTRELCLIEGTVLNGSFLLACSNIKTLGIPCNLTYFRFAQGATIENIVVKNLKNFISGDFATNYTFNRPSTGWDLYTTSDGINITKIENLIIPSDATFSNSINQTPFLYCKSVKNVTVPYNITSLRGFYRSKIESITFEANSTLTSLLNQCFLESSNLVFNVGNLPLTITTIGTDAFSGCSNITGSLNLPNLTSLNNGSFWTSGITGITKLGSVTAIPELCFLGCTSLTSVVLPSTCKTLGKYAFSGDTALTTINLSDVNRFGLLCFRNAGISGTLDLTNATIMEPYPFYKTLITKIIIPASTANNMTFIDTSNWLNLQSSGPDIAFAGLNSLTTIETDVEDWTVPFKAIACPNLQPFVIYQPLLTQTPVGVIGGGYRVDLLWSNKSLWTLAYYPALTDCRHTGYYVNNYRDNGGIMTLGQGTLILDLLYLKNVLDIDNAIFINLLANIVLNSTTVPNVWSHSQGSTTRTASTYFRGEYDSASTLIDIYVPDSAVNDYKTAWPNHVNHIFGISSLNQGVIYATEADWTAANKPAGLIAEYLGLSSADLATFMTNNNLTYWTNPNA